MTHGTLNCPSCHVTLGQDQFARGELQHIYEDGILRDVHREIAIYCPRCGAFALTFSLAEGKVIRVTPAHDAAETNRILAKLPHRPRAPIGTPTSRITYAPVEVPA